MKSENQEVWVTEDGQRFLLQAEAYEHELRYRLRKLLDEEGVGRGGEWDQSMFLSFLLAYKDELANIVSGDME